MKWILVNLKSGLMVLDISSYHPHINCKILIQSMLDRVRSSRAIAHNVRENVVYMYLAENLQPDFRTISDFRKENEKTNLI